MGVRGLWEIVGTVAKPIQLESLRNQRLAVDASIWIYQFLKAVRDGQGNVVKYAHIVGFFRRICKLLFFGIKPVFVFDGGAPALKRQTINRRKERREDREDDAAKTAAKLLTVQLQRLAASQVRSSPKSKGKNKVTYNAEIEESDKPVVYYEERGKTESERTKYDGIKKPFRPADQFHLPEIDRDRSLDVNDPRLMTEEELSQYANEFQVQLSKGIGLYDVSINLMTLLIVTVPLLTCLNQTSTVDFESTEFKSLPIATQYQLLNTARLKSRLRMGYSAEQLDQLFPDRMEFSKFQIQRVTQRNFLTQSIMNLVGLNDQGAQRIAGEKGGEYILNRNENGWTLALERERSQKNKATKYVDETQVREFAAAEDEEDEEGEEEDIDWEEIPIEEIPIEEIPIEEKKPDAQWEVNLQEQQDTHETETGLESILGFETSLQRQRLYEELQENAILEEELFGNEKEIEQMPTKTPSQPKMSQHGFMPFLLSGDSIEMLDKFKPTDKQKEKQRERENFDAKNEKFLENLSFIDSVLLGTNATDLILSEKENNEHMSGVGDKKSQDLNLRDHGEKSDTSFKKQPTLPPWLVQQPSSNHTTKNLEPFLGEAFGPRSGVDATDEIVPIDMIDKVLEMREMDAAEFASSEDREAENERDERERSPSPSPAAMVGSKTTVDAKDEIEDIDTPHSIPKFETGSHSTEKPEQDISEDTVLESDEHRQVLAQEDAKFQEEEDEQLVEQLVREIEENERFSKSLNNGNIASKSQEEYDEEIKRLRSQAKKEQRDADQVTNDMVRECQELLQRFGIPYITAPMEAEAQCGTLMELGLVDGIITDDSDCFLFGGSKIFKNMFNQSKWVECYELKDLEREFDLDRSKLIKLAQLLGSDYTDGLPGVGPVTALELLAEFNSKDGLIQFREWWKQVQMLDKDVDYSSEFKRKFKRNATKLFLRDNFPDKTVEMAYLEPEVDKDPTAFEWGKPDLDSLRSHLVMTTGWDKEKIDEMLVPVIRNMNQQQSHIRQSTLTEFAGVSALKRVEISGSKRMHKAMQSLVEQAQTRKKKPRKK